MARKQDEPKPPAEITEADALAALQAERQRRVAACQGEIQQVLQRHKAALHVRQVSVDGQPGPTEIFLTVE